MYTKDDALLGSWSAAFSICKSKEFSHKINLCHRGDDDDDALENGPVLHIAANKIKNVKNELWWSEHILSIWFTQIWIVSVLLLGVLQVLQHLMNIVVDISQQVSSIVRRQIGFSQFGYVLFPFVPLKGGYVKADQFWLVTWRLVVDAHAVVTLEKWIYRMKQM